MESQYEPIKLNLRLKLVNIMGLFYKVLVTVNILIFFIFKILKFSLLVALRRRRVLSRQCLATAPTQFGWMIIIFGVQLRQLKNHVIFFYLEVLDSNAIRYRTNNCKYRLSPIQHRYDRRNKNDLIVSSGFPLFRPWHRVSNHSFYFSSWSERCCFGRSKDVGCTNIENICRAPDNDPRRIFPSARYYYPRKD